MNARTPNEEKIIIGAVYPPVPSRTTPMRRGTRQSPMFWTQKMRQYAEPRIFSSMIFGTDGQRAAGTRENDTPRVTMRMRASTLLGNAGRMNAKLRWQTIMMMAPSISIEAPLPLKSRKAPRNGPQHTVTSCVGLSAW